jgi:prepilin-type N-terminal cleavage/methylation domain-containing protein
MTTNAPYRGYTLIELIVSVAIFSIVMLVAGAAFLALISLDRKARATNDVVTNLSYVIDSMERSVRTGTNYSCGGSGDCWATPRDSLSFTDANGRAVSYARVASGSTGYVRQCISGTCTQLTDPRINVARLDFYARGTAAGDPVQPMVVFVIRGVITPDATGVPVEFVTESAATQRLIDI